MSSSLTEEQRRRMEENRLKALERRAALIASRSGGTASAVNTVSSGSIHPSKLSSKPATTATTHPYSSRPNPTAPPVSTSKIKPIAGPCVMVSRDRFMVNIGYHQQLNDIYRSIPGHIFDVPTKKWTFPIDKYAELMKAVGTLKPMVSVGEIPAFVYRVFRNIQPGSSRTIPEVDLSRIDSTLVQALMPFQVEGVRFGISRNGRCLNSDDMGLGKSIQGLGIAHYYYSEWPLLIVCPSSVKYSWRDSVWKWLPTLNPGCVTVVETGKDSVDHAKVLITSYDMLQKRSEELRHCGVVIMDESHHLKNFKTARTKAAMPIMLGAKRLILLSGTPALSRPMELYTQISAINRNLFPSYEEFGIRYCSGKKNAWGWDFSGSSNMEELQLLLEETIMIRRMKSDVLQQLPSKMRKLVILDSTLVRSKNNKSLAATAAAFTAQKSMKSLERRGKLLEYYAETSAAKLDAVKSYITDVLEGGRKAICFAHHKSMMDGICEALEKSKKPYIRIDGQTDSEDRQIAVDIFQTRSDVLIAVLSITAANAGITLTAAKLVIFAELYWNPGILVQAEDRAHRIGQMDSVLVEYLVAKGTADDVLWDMIKQKLDVLNKAGLSKDNFSDASAKTLSQKGSGPGPHQTKLEKFFSQSSQSQERDSESEVMDFEAENELRQLEEDPALLDQLLDESFN